LSQNTIILFFPVFDYAYKGSEYIPYSVLQLERAVRHTGTDIVIIDENVDKDYEKIISKYKDSILIAAVSAITGFQIKGGLEFTQIIRKSAPQALVVWGGWHTTIVPEQTLMTHEIDFIITGQGEKPFSELTEAILNKQTYENIKGLGFKKDDKLCINPAEEFYNLNQFPDVNYTLIDVNKYVLQTDFSERRLMYFATYGCPFNCAFCSGAQIFKKKWFPKKLDSVIADLKYFIRVAHIDSILFWDDNFFSNKKFVLDFAQRLIDENINLLWEGSAHARSFLNMFTEQDVKLLYKAGLRRVSTGAETGDNKVLSIIKDNLKYQDVLLLIEFLNKNKITTFFSTMLGYPFDKNNDIDASFNFIRRAKLIDNNVKVQINIYTPYPHTHLYKNALEKGFKEPQQLSEWINHSPEKFKPPWIKKSFYSKIEAFMNFYLPFSEKNCYQRAPVNFKNVAFIFNVLLHPLLYMRFKYNFFIFPFEWYIFKSLLKRYNKKHNTHLKFYAYGVFGDVIRA